MALRKCSVAGCGFEEHPAGGRYLTKGFCYTHYERFRKYGNPLTVHTRGRRVGEPSLHDKILAFLATVDWATIKEIQAGTGIKARNKVSGLLNDMPASRIERAEHPCPQGHIYTKWRLKP